MNITASNVSLSFVLSVGENRLDQQNLTCEIHILKPPLSELDMVTISRKGDISVSFIHQTCAPGNSVLLSSAKGFSWPFFKFDYFSDKTVWTGCEPMYDPLPVYISSRQSLWVVLRVNDISRNYSVRMDVNISEPITPGMRLELVPMSGTLGNAIKKTRIIFE